MHISRRLAAVLSIVIGLGIAASPAAGALTANLSNADANTATTMSSTSVVMTNGSTDRSDIFSADYYDQYYNGSSWIDGAAVANGYADNAGTSVTLLTGVASGTQFRVRANHFVHSTQTYS